MPEPMTAMAAQKAIKELAKKQQKAAGTSVSRQKQELYEGQLMRKAQKAQAKEKGTKTIKQLSMKMTKVK